MSTSRITKGHPASNLAARWSLLAEEIRRLADASHANGTPTHQQRRRVAVLVAREAVALGVDLPLSAVEVITGSWAMDTGQDDGLPLASGCVHPDKRHPASWHPEMSPRKRETTPRQSKE